MSQRRLATVIVALACALLLALPAFAGGKQEAKPAATTDQKPAAQPAAQPSKYKEAPMLAELVKAGKLPAVEKRVPEEPMVVSVGDGNGLETIGKYGGVFAWDAFDAPNAQGRTNVTMPFTNMMDGRVLATGWKSYETKDNKTWTFFMRKGMKWSDGQPYTADDILFWWEDVAQNKELVANVPGWMTSAGKPAVMKKIDDYTFSITFEAPYPNFLPVLSWSSERQVMACPKHYLSQFNPKYAKKEDLDKRIKDAGVQTVGQLWELKYDRYYNSNPELPSLNPWIVKKGVPNNPAIWERNPYFWAVDSEGNQLPYTDEYRVTIVGDQERMKLRILNGDVTWGNVPLTGLELAKAAEKDGKVKTAVIPWPGDINSHTLMFNFLTPDPTKNKIISDVRFRRAMSLAMPRDQMNQLFYQGLVRTKQIGISDPKNAWYNEKLAKAYVSYDLVAANKLLDEMGLSKKDKDGFRLAPDGSALAFSFVTMQGWDVEWAVVPEYLAKVGLKVTFRTLGWDQLTDFLREAKWELFGQQDAGGYPFLWPNGMDCFRASSWTGYAWRQWFDTQGKEGVEPPQIVKDVEAVHVKAKAAATPEELKQAILKLEDYAAENMWAVGLLSFPPRLVAMNPKVANVPSNHIRFFEPVLYFK